MTPEEVVTEITLAIKKDPEAECFVTWECPACKEHVTCVEPNMFYTKGFQHEECGCLYNGDEYGLVIVSSQYWQGSLRN